MEPNDSLKKKILHQCPECARIFQYKSKLDRHFLVHSKVKQFVCQLCRAGFSLAYNLQVHMRIHKGIRPYKCHHPYCGKSFTQSNNLTVHLRLHKGCYNKVWKNIDRDWNARTGDKVENDKETICSEGDFSIFVDSW